MEVVDLSVLICAGQAVPCLAIPIVTEIPIIVGTIVNDR